MNILIVYGSTYGNTEDAAYKIADAFMGAAGLRLTEVTLEDVGTRVLDVSQFKESDLQDVDLVLLGASTWDFGQLQADWDVVLDEIATFDWRGRRVALFGQGDQMVYEDTYLDALGTIAERLEPRGARLFGAWPAAGYAGVTSRALRGDHFVGLALDEDNEHDATKERIDTWVRALADAVAHELDSGSSSAARASGAAVQTTSLDAVLEPA